MRKPEETNQEFIQRVNEEYEELKQHFATVTLPCFVCNIELTPDMKRYNYSYAMWCFC